ncbi:NUDIX domain-containing protein [Arthrobacter sp. NPDC056727]|uniref:NUDIX domain-containing protein n=1 Tax=Arthrobacter sp. NPDC056727 TaxID=3345927 RepID=UPI00366B57E0
MAVVLQWRGKIAMLKRSNTVGHDRGRWHCITGYLEPGASPREQAVLELAEETGLTRTEILDLAPGPTLTLIDNTGATWIVHTFTAMTSKRRLSLDWEHESFRWTAPEKTARFANRVPWLDTVLAATGHLGL